MSLAMAPWHGAKVRNVGKVAMSRARETKLAREIKRLRLNLRLTQEQFASRVGVTFSTVNRWEGGKSKPSPLAMRQIKELMRRTGDGE